MFPPFLCYWKDRRGVLLFRVSPFVAVGAVLVLVNPVQGQVTAYSVPQGSLMVNIPAATNDVPSVTTFSLPMSTPVPTTFVGQYVGQITGMIPLWASIRQEVCLTDSLGHGANHPLSTSRA